MKENISENLLNSYFWLFHARNQGFHVAHSFCKTHFSSQTTPALLLAALLSFFTANRKSLPYGEELRNLLLCPSISSFLIGLCRYTQNLPLLETLDGTQGTTKYIEGYLMAFPYMTKYQGYLKASHIWQSFRDTWRHPIYDKVSGILEGIPYMTKYQGYLKASHIWQSIRDTWQHPIYDKVSGILKGIGTKNLTLNCLACQIRYVGLKFEF